MPFSEWLTIRPARWLKDLERKFKNQESRPLAALSTPTDPEALLPGLLQGAVNSDRLAFVHRDRIQHERRGDRLVGAIAG